MNKKEISPVKNNKLFFKFLLKLNAAAYFNQTPEPTILLPVNLTVNLLDPAPTIAFVSSHFNSKMVTADVLRQTINHLFVSG